MTNTNAMREVMTMSCFTLVVDVLAARSSYAKDREHTSPGRSPDFWLQALLTMPSHSISEQWLDLFAKEDELLTSYSSA